MSLSASLSSAVSGLTAQSAALSAISENIANSSTTGYKTKETSFEALVSASMKSSAAAGGVTTSMSRAMSVQGTISTSATETNLAINGSGYFIVADNTSGATSDLAYTRNGSFSTDASGYLVNSEGYYLQGYPTDEDGNVIGGGVSGLETINLSNLTSPAEATSTVSVSAILPAEAEVGDTFTSTASVVDSLGATNIVDQTWTKTDTNTWTLTTGNPYSATTGEETGTASATTITITFDTSGLPATISPDPADVTFSFTNGAADATVEMDLGEIGSSSGVTQSDSGGNDPSLTVNSISNDGIVAGSLTSVAINDGGQVEATFSNGLTKVIYQVPVATFANSEGLTQVSGTTFKSTNLSGSATINLSGVGASGSIVASALEGSTTDTATEFNKMIVAQQAYSAASQVVGSVKDMFDTLISVVR
ncbi:flagellar hook protein FlgE [Brevundimonas intermedia]|uniref:Flagellar hook protein FlgE n=1 Tax=Brevundimonas intermedia TaxID=74315 RepID=A0ABQ5T3B4_9CAUL|nr:flagellar hook protein FlgE [Brevundimonas intermedia]GLK47239.1 flagellar hook protein FlgE [Brevundimonas intermedia]